MIQIMFLASLVATPSTLSAQIAAARPGDTITLRAGSYRTVNIINRRYGKPVQIDAGDARLSSLTIRNSTGVKWTGGSLMAPRSQTFGVTIVDSSKIAISGMKVTGPRIGLTMARATDIDVIGNSFDGVRSDGINIAMSQRVRVVGNACINFRPNRATYSSDGRLLVDGDHADCIQGWSRLGYPPTADITITDNAAEGEMQGISFFDPGQGGYDRITVTNNDMSLRYWNGIVIFESRGSTVTGNRVRTIPGARAQNWPFNFIKTWINVTGSRNRVCGNTVEAIPDGEGTEPCD